MQQREAAGFVSGGQYCDEISIALGGAGFFCDRGKPRNIFSILKTMYSVPYIHGVPVKVLYSIYILMCLAYDTSIT